MFNQDKRAGRADLKIRNENECKKHGTQLSVSSNVDRFVTKLSSNVDGFVTKLSSNVDGFVTKLSSNVYGLVTKLFQYFTASPRSAGLSTVFCGQCQLSGISSPLACSD